MSAPKILESRIKWTHQPFTDTARCTVPVIVPSRPSYNCRLAMTAHVSRIPLKYGFSLLLGSHRVCGLDVNPGRAHANFRTGKRETIWDTHWQVWPNAEHVEADGRELSHRQWFLEFCRRNTTAISSSYSKPPYIGGEQLWLFWSNGKDG